MAFTPIDSNTIKVGDPLKKDLFDLIKSNEDDLDSRVSALSLTANRIVVFDHTILNVTSSTTLTGLNFFRAISDFNLIGGIVSIFEKGSLTGTLEIDVKKNSTPNDTGMTSVFTTRPSITYAGASDYEESSNQVFNAGVATISTGDYLRLDVTSLPSNGVIGKFRVIIFGEP